MLHAEIIANIPDLTEEDIRACLGYAAERERDVMISFSQHETAAWASLEPQTGEEAGGRVSRLDADAIAELRMAVARDAGLETTDLH